MNTRTETLEVTTPSDREITMKRVFDAPRQLVFDCLTKPALLKRWGLGPPGWSMAVCEVDLRVGGAWRYVLRGPGGREMGMGGVFREIVPPERIVQTEKFDDYPNVAINTTVLTEQGGKSTLQVTLLYDSQATRDAVLKSGMAEGASQTYDRLADLLPVLAAEAI